MSKPENQKSHDYKHLLLTPEVHLIKDHLDLNLMCEYQNVKTKGLDYSHEFNYFSYGAEIRYMTGNWNIGYGAYKVERVLGRKDKRRRANLQSCRNLQL